MRKFCSYNYGIKFENMLFINDNDEPYFLKYIGDIAYILLIYKDIYKCRKNGCWNVIEGKNKM